MNLFTIFAIEETALEWFKDMGYIIVFGGDISSENMMACLRIGCSSEVDGGRGPREEVEITL